MVVSQLIGGLGNQMFQYAAGRALSLERNTSFLLDISQFDSYTRHQGFELARIFTLSTPIATNKDVRSVLGWQSSHNVRRIISRPFMSSFRRETFVVEPHFHFWPGVDTIPPVVYMQGYWQSPRYFQRHMATIRKDFEFKFPLTGRNIEVAAQISQTNAVSLHVRRGDYLSNKKTANLHGLCSIDYYREAIKNIGDQIESPIFFVFSDDMDWVRKNLEIEFPCYFVDHNQGLDSFNDMRLMSLCRHNIIANSSFSWWGAWLNANQNKLVVGPKKWFAISTDTSDLIPETWTLL